MSSCHSNDMRTIINWRWNRCVSTHMAGHARSSLSMTQGERRLLFRGWTHIRHMTRDTCMGSPGRCTASHTRRERQVSGTISSATSLVPSLSSASRIERARSRLQARDFGKAGQRIREGSCKLGTFVHTHCPKVTNMKQTATYISALHGLALESNLLIWFQNFRAIHQ